MKGTAYRIRMLETAERDLDVVDAWLIENKPELARHWVADVQAAIESLARLPTRCPRLTGPGQDVRKLVVGRDLIVFEIAANEVLVLRVFHEGRDPSSLG